MKRITKLCVATWIALLAPAALATGIPDLSNSYVTWAYEGGETLSLMNLPDGNGHGLDQALLPGPADGSAPRFVDATITLTMLDWAMTPVYLFPFEDLWLESLDGGMVACIGGTVADASTDMNGQTEWRHPLLAGGWSEAGIQVVINGDAVRDAPLPLRVNSPDIDGDGAVNLSDVGFFASDYFTDYGYRSDFNYDGALNLSDVGFLVAGIGAQCP